MPGSSALASRSTTYNCLVTSVEVRLTDSQAEQLVQVAQRLGVTPEDLLRAAAMDLLEDRDGGFLATARHVIEKNAELYQRLA